MKQVCVVTLPGLNKNRLFCSLCPLANQTDFFTPQPPETAEEPWRRQGLQKSPHFYLQMKLDSGGFPPGPPRPGGFVLSQCWAPSFHSS